MRLVRATSLRLTVVAAVVALCTAAASAQMDSSGAMTATTDSSGGWIGILIIVLIPLFGVAIGVVSMMVDKMLRGTR